MLTATLSCDVTCYYNLFCLKEELVITNVPLKNKLWPTIQTTKRLIKCKFVNSFRFYRYLMCLIINARTGYYPFDLKMIMHLLALLFQQK